MAEQGQSQRPERDDREPSEERKTELESAYQQNVTQGQSPYYRVQIRTYGELLWIFTQRGWSCEVFLPEGRVRPDLQGAILIAVQMERVILRDASLQGADLTAARLQGGDLSGARLQGANLMNVQMEGTDLRDAQLERVNLRGAQMKRANLSDAQLEGANLRGAQMEGADLSSVQMEGAILKSAKLDGAILKGAQIEGADFKEVHLVDTDMRYAVMNNQTILDGVWLNEGTKLGDIKWNGAYLTRVGWNQVARLGDEQSITKATNRYDRIIACLDAARAYRGLRIELKNQGLLLPASRFRLREQQLERRALLSRRKIIPWFGSWILDLVSGYGERPGRIFGAYVIVVASFAALYWGMSNFLHTVTQRLQWYEALVLSLSSFHGRGFFPSSISLGDSPCLVE